MMPLKEILTREEYIKILVDRGVPEVCAVYDEDTIATLEAQIVKAKQCLGAKDATK